MKKSDMKFIAIRATKQMHDDFKAKTLPHGGSSKVLRELIEAFIDDRVTIVIKKEHYHVD
jgi:hypothetical protein